MRETSGRSVPRVSWTCDLALRPGPVSCDLQRSFVSLANVRSLHGFSPRHVFSPAVSLHVFSPANVRWVPANQLSQPNQLRFRECSRLGRWVRYLSSCLHWGMGSILSVFSLYRRRAVCRYSPLGPGGDHERRKSRARETVRRERPGEEPGTLSDREVPYLCLLSTVS